MVACHCWFFLPVCKKSDTYLKYQSYFYAFFEVCFLHVSSLRNAFQLGLMHFIIDKHVWVSFIANACCFGKLGTNYCYQTTDGSFSFSISPDHEAVFLAVLWRDLHKAEFLIASLQGARLDSASHPFFHGKKMREILETAAKRISAYTWSPLWSLSNKRRSFNLVTTGAFHYTPHAQILARKISAPPNVPDESSDLTKFMNMTMNIL